MSRYLICGYGNIGKHILKEFKTIARDFYIYDRYKDTVQAYGYSWHCNYSTILEKEYDVAFVCVPTEMNEDGSCDMSEVLWVLDRLKNVKNIVIRSAIPPTNYLTYAGNVFISPEFYGTTQHCEESPNFCILGGNKHNSSPVVQLYQRVKDGSFRFIFTDFNTAALAKYMENCWIATKVTFCNEFASIGKEFGVDYAALRECWLADPRVSPSHTFVYEDKPYYDSHCLNKDIPALRSFARNSPLMDAVAEINKSRKDKLS